MKISYFFEEKLGAKLKNWRNSWGAINTQESFLALRVWSDEITNDGKYVKVLTKNIISKSQGWPERIKHIEMMKRGIKAYGVLCEPKIKKDRSRSIKSFDEKNLILLGEIKKTKNEIFAKIEQKVPMELIDFKNFNSVEEDILKIFKNNKLKETSKKAEVALRLGQGDFRINVLQKWDNKCSVTYCDIKTVIVASHIKPWRLSNNDERQDEENGLPLIATLDALFDKGYISFNSNGDIIIASILNDNQKKLLQLNGAKLWKKPSQRTKEYLEYHRDNIFDQS